MKIVELFSAFYGLAVSFALLWLAGQWIAERLERWCEKRCSAK